MKRLHGSARQHVSVGVEEAYRLTRAVERYPEWHRDVVREVRVLSRGPEGAERVAATLRTRLGPLDRDFDIVLTVRAQAEREVILERAPNEPGDREQMSVHWTLLPAPDGSGCELALEMEAALDVPRLVPLPPGLGDGLAGGFVAAAARRLTR